jgi:hypothetical protein
MRRDRDAQVDASTKESLRGARLTPIQQKIVERESREDAVVVGHGGHTRAQERGTVRRDLPCAGKLVLQIYAVVRVVSQAVRAVRYPVRVALVPWNRRFP